MLAESLNYWKTTKLMVVNPGFPKLLLSSKSLNFIIGSKYCHLFP